MVLCVLSLFQLFYCEQRKPLVSVHFEDFTMPGWLSMLIGTESTEVCVCISVCVCALPDSTEQHCKAGQLPETLLSCL